MGEAKEEEKWKGSGGAQMYPTRCGETGKDISLRAKDEGEKKGAAPETGERAAIEEEEEGGGDGDGGSEKRGDIGDAGREDRCGGRWASAIRILRGTVWAVAIGRSKGCRRLADPAAAFREGESEALWWW